MRTVLPVPIAACIAPELSDIPDGSAPGNAATLTDTVWARSAALERARNTAAIRRITTARRMAPGAALVKQDSGSGHLARRNAVRQPSR